MVDKAKADRRLVSRGGQGQGRQEVRGQLVDKAKVDRRILGQMVNKAKADRRILGVLLDKLG